ncbi:hypothetical protein F4824DRAFT_98627 [Ustulina deusta]|nr:hypothetical protein F4824DRAFT_42946 [Ustulina deusta]KAI3338116.1 hypothetical protein F4824DRAFT_98627 [Ustulina deusta]
MRASFHHGDEPVSFISHPSNSGSILKLSLPRLAGFHVLRKAETARIVCVSLALGSVQMVITPETAFYNFATRAYDCSKVGLNMLALNFTRACRADDVSTTQRKAIGSVSG